MVLRLTEERVTASDPEDDMMVKYVCVRFRDGGGVEEQRRGLLLGRTGVVGRKDG
jgi:hypothetical protein